ncbi:MAG: hypothetical protein E6J64_04725 [Deltaproteobacteria bacterium]|nr:MAG: hypothetical protein E6J64_04725 [Deltaproteobacteria bacterium]
MKRLVVVAAAAAGLACTSLSTVQTASPVGAGKTRIAIAPQVTTFTPPTGGPFGGGPNASTAVVVPNLELAARFGLSDDADVGVKAGPAGASLDLKYALANNPGFVVSIAPGGGVLYVNNGGNPSSSLTTLNLFLPLLFGVRSGTTEVVFGPKLLFTHVEPSPGTGDHAFLLGGVFGVAFRAGNLLVMPEVNLATIVETSCNGTCANNTGGLGMQAGIGFYFDR